jgi:hypothetical protein
MIFSRFLTPDYAKPNPKTRINAIAKLNPDDPKNKQILHELAFNDENDDVNLRALDKLNSFALWQKTAQTSKNQRIKKYAIKRVHHAVLSESELSEAERKQFIIESADAELVNALLEQGGGLLQDVEFMLTLLQKTSKPAVVDSVFLKYANTALRTRLIEEQSELSVLQKWQKKVDDEHIKSVLKRRISQLEELSARPQALSAELRLLLSKLLALSESNDYLAFDNERQVLNRQYADLHQELNILKEREQVELEEKKLSIDKKLDFRQSQLLSAYEQSREKQKLAESVAEFEKRISASTKAVEALFSKIDSATLAELEETQCVLQSLAEEIEESASRLGRSFSEPANLKLSSLSQKLTRIPQWQQQTQAITSTLSELNSKKDDLLTSPQFINVALPEMEKQFFSVYDTSSPIAKTHLQQWQAIKSDLLSAQKDDYADIKRRVQKLRKPLNIVSRLIEHGKYRAAINQFREVKMCWDGEESQIKDELEHKYQDVLAQVERLEGWQRYLAEPRKPQLLEEARALIDDEAMSMVQRADKIKVLRRQWQSLSLPAQTLQKSASNKEPEQEAEFDQLLELAFAPCRTFFAKQEAERNAAVAARQSVIDKLQVLNQNESIEAVDLFQSSTPLIKQWYTLNSVPRSEYQTLRAAFDAVRTDIQQKLTPYFEANKLEKQALLKRSEKLAELESSKDVTEQAKQLQQQWKTVGFAGEKADRKLWNAFRDKNDIVFAKAKQDKANRKAELETEINELEQQVETLRLQCCDMEDEAFVNALSHLEQAAKSLPKAPQERLKNSLRQIEQQRQDFITQRNNEKLQQEVRALSLVLQTLVDQPNKAVTDLPAFSQLPKAWQGSLNNPKSAKETLLHGVVLLETLLDLSSPESDKALKTDIQLQRLNESFNSNTATDTNKQLQWVLSVFGNNPDAILLTRIIDCVKAAHLT